jgi:outer membrane protein
MKNIFVALLFIVTVESTAQDSLRTLSFKEAVNIGLKNNLTLNQQKNFLVSNKVNRTSNLMSMGPTVNLNASAARTDGNRLITLVDGVKTVNGVSDNMGASIDANMPLFGGFSSFKNFQQASAQYDAQLHHVERTTQDVIRDIARQYLTCLLDEQLVKINEKNLETQSTQLEQITELVSAGARAEIDQKNQEYQVRNAELLLIRSKNTLSNDKNLLAQTLQLDPTIPFTLTEPGWELTMSDTVTVEELLVIAKKQRNDLKRAELNEKAAKYAMQSARGSYFPQLSLFASYGSAYNYVYRTIEPYPVNRSFHDQFFNDFTQLVYGLRLTIPIYNAHQFKNNVVRNKVLYKNAELQADNANLLMKSEVIQAVQNLTDAKSAYRAAQAQLQAAEISFSLEKERYNLGISDIVALTQATQAYTRAQADYASARYTLMFQQLSINYASGTLRFEDIP